MNYWGMGSMDHPVRWDEERTMAYHIKNSHIARITLITLGMMYLPS
jgi:hypothetical protein